MYTDNIIINVTVSLPYDILTISAIGVGLKYWQCDTWGREENFTTKLHCISVTR